MAYNYTLTKKTTCLYLFAWMIFSSHLFALPSTENVLSLKSSPPPLIAIRLNGGKSKYTNKRRVKVELRSLKVPEDKIQSFMVGLKSDLSGSVWKPWILKASQVYVTLEGKDGVKSVYVRLKDKTGKISPVEVAKIILDTTPPQNAKIEINRGNPFTRDPQGRTILTFQVKGATELKVSNHKDFRNDAKWEPFVKSKKWIISSTGDGKKFVYARFKDSRGNTSQVFRGEITIDTKPPTNCKARINSGDKYTNSGKVTIGVSGEGIDMVRVIDPLKSSIFKFKPTESKKNAMDIEWVFDDLSQGRKAIKVFFMDKIKNATTHPVLDDIILDTKPPQPAIVQINGGNKYHKGSQNRVSLRINTNDDQNTISTLISNEPDFLNVTPSKYTSNVSWVTSDNQDGEKKVYVRFMDQAKNQSEATIASIIFDRNPPCAYKDDAP